MGMEKRFGIPMRRFCADTTSSTASAIATPGMYAGLEAALRRR